MIQPTNNIDASEIAKFDALAHEWWDPKGPMKPLHQLNPLRLAYVERHVDIMNKRVLDIGCGAGILTESLAIAGALATGIDMSESAIKIAQQHAKQNNVDVTYEQIRTEDFAEKNAAQFDVVTCMEMLEHVPDPTSIIQAASKLVKPNGFVFFSTLNRNIKSFFQAIVGAEYILRLLPRGTHTYEKFIRPSELSHWATAADLTACNIQGIHYNPITGKFSETNNVDVNYLMVFQKE